MKKQMRLTFHGNKNMPIDWTISLFHLSPLLILVVGSLSILMLDAFFPQLKKTVFGLSLLIIILSFIFSCQLWNIDTKYFFNEAIRLDRFSLFITQLSLFLTFLTFLNSYPSLKQNQLPSGEYAFFLLASCFGMALMAWTTDLITLFLSLEIMSLGAYVLTGIQKQRLSSVEGALKYFLLGAFSTGFLLYGILSIYACTGSTQFGALAPFLLNSQHTLPTLFYVGIGFLIIGLGFKIAAVPFHMWVPDVYEGAPTMITAWMATGVKAASFSALVRLFLVPLLTTKSEWNMLLMILAVATMTVGNVAALLQSNIKRMLAYSSIAHAGYILIAFVAASHDVFDLSVSAILFYLIAYGLMTIGAFAVVIYASQIEDKNNISDYAGFGFKHPWLGLAMIVFMLSLIGIPPTAGFIGKFYIFSAAIKAKFFTLAILGIMNSIISAYYYLYILVVFYMKKLDGLGERPLIYSAILTSVLIITVIGTLGLGLAPSQTLKFISQSVTALLL